MTTINRALTLIVGLLLPVAGYKVGVFMTEQHATLEQVNAEGHCKQETRFDAYVSKADDGWHCFKQNIENKKLSRTAIVFKDVEAP